MDKDNLSSNFGRINFPLYAVCPLSSNHVIVAGGGGSSNTGIFNGLAICEIGFEKNEYVAYEIQRYDTKPIAIMNCSIGTSSKSKKFFLAAGRNENCYIYQLKLDTKVHEIIQQHDSKGDGDILKSENSTIRKRRSLGTTNGLKPSSEKKKWNPEKTEFIFDIKSLQFVQTDFSPVDPFQNAVVFSSDARLVVTGGTDGSLRVWNFPEMKLKTKIDVSKKEIADIDISQDKKYVCCVAKDGNCKLWTTNDGKLCCSMDLPPEDERRFIYKRCKFGVIEDKENLTRCFAILNPTNYKRDKSYIQQWTTEPGFGLTKIVAVGEMLSALAISHCGRYLAVGSMTNGDISIYISFSLQRLRYIPHAHKTFVTGLSFLPPTQPNEESVLANCDAAVVSISIDNQIRVHPIEKTVGISMWLAVLLVIGTLILTFIGCSYFDL